MRGSASRCWPAGRGGGGSGGSTRPRTWWTSRRGRRRCGPRCVLARSPAHTLTAPSRAGPAHGVGSERGDEAAQNLRECCEEPRRQLHHRRRCEHTHARAHANARTHRDSQAGRSCNSTTTPLAGLPCRAFSCSTSSWCGTWSACRSKPREAPRPLQRSSGRPLWRRGGRWGQSLFCTLNATLDVWSSPASGGERGGGGEVIILLAWRRRPQLETNTTLLSASDLRQRLRPDGWGGSTPDAGRVEGVGGRLAPRRSHASPARSAKRFSPSPPPPPPSPRNRRRRSWRRQWRPAEWRRAPINSIQSKRYFLIQGN